MSAPVAQTVLLAVLLAIIGFNAVLGPRGYRTLVQADVAARTSIFRRMLIGQLLLFTLPAIVGLLVLGRFGAVIDLPRELWPPASWLRGGDVPVTPDPFLSAVFTIEALAALPLGAALTWRRTRQGKGPPRSIAHIAALLPRNRTELLYATAISLMAGIGEEL